MKRNQFYKGPMDDIWESDKSSEEWKNYFRLKWSAGNVPEQFN